MKVPLPIPCSECGVFDPVDIHLNDDSPVWVCKNGHRNQGLFPLDFTVGKRILVKSFYELVTRRDFSMSIVFAAMGLECELSYRFAKWTHIEVGLRGDRRLDDEEIEKMLRRFRTIADRLEATCRLLDTRGIDQYVDDTADLRDTIQNGFPSLTLGTLAQDFQQTVFWPRNRILHFGYAEYVQVDAERCYSIANLGIEILGRLDKSKYAATFP
jgi:hypothetical protein